MIYSRVFPKDNGLILDSVIEEVTTVTDDSVTKIKITINNFSIDGVSVTVSEAQEFDMNLNDVVYITPKGLVKCDKTAYPSDLFSNGACYWIVQRISNTEYIKLEVR